MTPKVCENCQRVIGWYKQEFIGDILRKRGERQWNCPICKGKKEK